MSIEPQNSSRPEAGAAAPDSYAPDSAAASEPAPTPRISFVSLGCPKALVDSERIVTRLRAEGYELARNHAGADLVIVNTCGFLDSAKTESLEAIGAALAENGKVVVTGCLGAEPETITDRYPNLIAVTGPQQFESVMAAVHRAAPRPHAPFLDLVPPQGVRLTPRHYAYLKISEGCNNRCTFCIIPRLRGDLVSRRAADVLREAEKLVDAGVKELIVISQDTSAYGVDLKYEASAWGEQDVRARFVDLARALGEFDVWVRLHYVYPYPHVDERDPADGGGHAASLSRRAVPACRARGARAHEAASRAGKDARAHSPLARDLPRPHDPLDLHCRLSRRDRGGLRLPARLAGGGRARPGRMLPLRAGQGRCRRTISRRPSPTRSRRSAGIVSWLASRRFRQSA